MNSVVHSTLLLAGHWLEQVLQTTIREDAVQNIASLIAVGTFLLSGCGNSSKSSDVRPTGTQPSNSQAGRSSVCEGSGCGPTLDLGVAGNSALNGTPLSVCTGCVQAACASNAKTSLSGSVFAPNGTLPLYNAIVYVRRAHHRSRRDHRPYRR
jgi:hypothetical protein